MIDDHGRLENFGVSSLERLPAHGVLCVFELLKKILGIKCEARKVEDQVWEISKSYGLHKEPESSLVIHKLALEHSEIWNVSTQNRILVWLPVYSIMNPRSRSLNQIPNRNDHHIHIEQIQLDQSVQPQTEPWIFDDLGSLIDLCLEISRASLNCIFETTSHSRIVDQTASLSRLRLKAQLSQKSHKDRRTRSARSSDESELSTAHPIAQRLSFL